MNAAATQRGVGLILAGGAGRRIGGEKHLRQLAGRPLLDHVLARLQPQVASLAVAVGAGPVPALPPGITPLFDPFDQPQGPLAGLLSGLQWMNAEHPKATFLTMAPVDTPLLPLTLVDQLAPALESADAAIAASAGRATPVVGLFRPCLEGRLREFLGTDPGRAISDFLSGVSVREVEVTADPELAAIGADPLLNINTPADLEAAEAVLARCRGSSSRV